MLDHVNDFESFGVFAVWPTNREIALAVEAIVERASEVENVGD